MPNRKIYHFQIPFNQDIYFIKPVGGANFPNSSISSAGDSSPAGQTALALVLRNMANSDPKKEAGTTAKTGVAWDAVAGNFNAIIDTSTNETAELTLTSSDGVVRSTSTTLLSETSPVTPLAVRTAQSAALLSALSARS